MSGDCTNIIKINKKLVIFAQHLMKGILDSMDFNLQRPKLSAT
jgi:hypothetical protein